MPYLHSFWPSCLICRLYLKNLRRGCNVCQLPSIQGIQKKPETAGSELLPQGVFPGWLPDRWSFEEDVGCSEGRVLRIWQQRQHAGLCGGTKIHLIQEVIYRKRCLINFHDCWISNKTIMRRVLNFSTRFLFYKNFPTLVVLYIFKVKMVKYLFKLKFLNLF